MIALTAEWQALDTEPIYGGTVGGDGAGEAWSVRFGKRNADGTYAFITANYYTVDIAIRNAATVREGEVAEDEPERFDIECQTEFLICTDPDDLGGTEKWSDYQYDDDITVVALPEDEADKIAKQYAARELTMFEAFYSWDGEPF